MREKFDILDELADQFSFNWDSDKRNKKLNDMMNNDDVRRRARTNAERARDAAQRNMRTSTNMPAMMGASQYGSGDLYDPSYGGEPYDDNNSYDEYGGTPSLPSSLGSTSPVPEDWSDERMQEEVDRQLRLIVESELEQRTNQELAYKYLVGVYESSEFHLATLKKIHRYFLNAANSGDPIAQVHLALFLRYLGDIVDPYTDAAGHSSESMKWLEQASTSDVAKKRVEELIAQFAAEANKENRRAEDRTKKIDKLLQVETEKLNLFDTILIRVRDSIGNSGSTTGGRRGTDGRSGGGLGGEQRNRTGGTSRGNSGY
jgi:hypothetical protein